MHTHTHTSVGSKKARTHLQLTGKQLTHFVVATFLWQLSGWHSTCALLRCFFIAVSGCDSDSDSRFPILLSLSLLRSLSLSCVSDEFWPRIQSICVHIVQYYTSAWVCECVRVCVCKAGARAGRVTAQYIRHLSPSFAPTAAAAAWGVAGAEAVALWLPHVAKLLSVARRQGRKE